MKFRLLALGFLLTSLAPLAGQTGEAGIRSFNTPSSNPLADTGIGIRYSSFSTASSPEAGYLLLEDIQPLASPYNNWSIASFSTFTASGADQNESGVITLNQPLNREVNYSNPVGVVPVNNPLSSSSSIALDADFSPPADANASFLHGRILAEFGATETQNLAYFVDEVGVSLALQSNLVVNDGGNQTPIAELNLFSTGNGTQLSGVSGTDQNPVLAFQFQTQDANQNGVADPIDPGKLWWETSPALEDFWRYTDGAVNLDTSIGVVYDREWPWVYAYNVQGRKWIWIYDDLENPNPAQFWAWNEDGYWIFFDTTNGRFYYRWDLKRWFSF